MMRTPYIQAVIRELELLGYDSQQAKDVLVRYYKVMRRNFGFGPSPRDFAYEIDEIHKAVNRVSDPADPNQIYIGHLRDRIKLVSNRQSPMLPGETGDFMKLLF